MKTKLPFGVQILTLTLVTVFSWIAFEVYRTVSVKNTATVQPNIINPLDPTISEDLLNSLKDKVYLNENSIEDTLLISEESEIPEEIEVASESASQPESTETAQIEEPQP